jgi:hypothetical protein
MAVTSIAALLALDPAPALSQSDKVAEHYRGKRLTVVVNNAPGGSTDAWLSLLARHLGRHIPGKPRVLLSHRGGGGGIVGTRYLLEVARPDGYTIGGLGSGMVRGQAIGDVPEEVDLRKFTIFGGVNEVSIAYARRAIFPEGVKTLLKREPTRRPFFPATTTKDDASVRHYVWLKLLGYEPGKDYKHLSGWPGGAAEVYLAMQRGEVDFGDTRIGGFKTSVMPLVEEGIAVPIWQSGMFNDEGKVVRHPAFPKISTFVETYEQHVGKITPGPDWEFLSWRRATESPLRPLVAPPGTPQHLVDGLIDALRKMQSDPAYQRDQEKLYGTKEAVHVVGDAARKAVMEVIEGSKKSKRFFEEHIEKF